VHGQIVPEGGNFVRKIIAHFIPQALRPFFQCGARCMVQPINLIFSKFLGEQYGGQAGAVKNFI
jgi:hypothetical protein